LENLEDINEARINCCGHKYCSECIFNWATKEENNCPLCKQKFNLIYKKKENGEE
jgi:hypothetical protein